MNKALFLTVLGQLPGVEIIEHEELETPGLDMLMNPKRRQELCKPDDWYRQFEQRDKRKNYKG